MSGFSSSLRRQGGALLAIGLGGFLADYAFNVGLSRMLSAHAFGDFRVAQAFAAFFGVVVLLGGDRAAPKALAGPIERNESAAVWGYIRFYLRVALALSVAIIGLTWLASALHVGSQDPLDHHAVAWVVMTVPLSAIGALASRGLQSARLQAAAALPWRVVHPLASLGLVLAAASLLGDVTVAQVIVLSAAVVALIAAWQWWRLTVRVPRVESHESVPWQPRAWLAASLPMMGAFLVAIGLNQSDLYVLEALGDDHQVGHYAAAATTAHVLLLVQTTVMGLFAPLLQPAIESGGAEARSLRTRARGTLLLGLLPAAAALVLAGRPILALFGPGYDDAGHVLVYLTGGAVAWALAAPDVMWLQFTGRGLQVIVVTAIALGADLLLNVLLVPEHGMEGAAAATLLTLTVASLSVVVLARRS